MRISNEISQSIQINFNFEIVNSFKELKSFVMIPRVTRRTETASLTSRRIDIATQLDLFGHF